MKKKLTTLTIEEEKEFLKLAKEGTKLAKEGKKIPLRSLRATRLLISYNLNFIKYIVRGYYSYLQEWIKQEDLILQGIIALEKAIGKFDIESKHRFATYAGYWIHQHIQTYIHRSNFIPIVKKKVEEDNEKFVKESFNITYYDKELDDDKEEKSYSVIDNLSENDELEVGQNCQKDIQKQINQVISDLEEEEALVIRLTYHIMPYNLFHVYQIANKDEKKELLKFFSQLQKKNKKELEMAKISCQEEKVRCLPIIEKYLNLCSRPWRMKEISKIMKKSDVATRELRKIALEKIKKIASEKKLDLLL